MHKDNVNYSVVAIWILPKKDIPALFNKSGSLGFSEA